MYSRYDIHVFNTISHVISVSRVLKRAFNSLHFVSSPPPPPSSLPPLSHITASPPPSSLPHLPHPHCLPSPLLPPLHPSSLITCITVVAERSVNCCVTLSLVLLHSSMAIPQIHGPVCPLSNIVYCLAYT